MGFVSLLRALVDFLRRHTIFRRVFLVLLFFFSFRAAVLEIRANTIYREVTVWPRTDAKIFSADVLVTNFLWSYQQSNFCANFRFSYTVSGRTFVERNRTLGLACWPEGYSFIREHQPGSLIEIAYNPADPSIAVVPSNLDKPGFPWFDLFGGICLFILLCFDVLSSRRQNLHPNSGAAGCPTLDL